MFFSKWEHTIISSMSSTWTLRKCDILQRSLELRKVQCLDEACEAKNRANIAALDINVADTNSISESEILSKPSVDV